MAEQDDSITVRVGADTKKKLQAWLDQLNAGRRVPLKFSAFIRGFLEYGAEARPDWESRDGGG